MNDINAEQLHNKLLKIVKDFHSFCQEHNIRYYILGGTALGAVRHNGFIPWDDDIDIGIPRDDYDRLINLIDYLPDNLTCKYYKNTQHSPMHYIKIVDKNTTLIEKFYNYIVEGIYIDVFPLDGAIKDDASDIKRRKKIYSLFNKICWKCNTEYKKGILRKCYKLYCRLFNIDKMHHKLENLMTKVDFGKGDSVANFMGAYREKECVDLDCFGEPVLYKFEDTYLFGPSDIHKYLGCLYGDYMKLPPENERVLHHSFLFLDLEKPFEKFLDENKGKNYF